VAVTVVAAIGLESGDTKTTNAFIQNNIIVGNLTYVDDGIVVEGTNVQGLNVSYNRISNVFDCGIEFLGWINGATVTNNTVTNASQFGVCAYYGAGSTAPLQITGSTFTGNSNTGGGGALGFAPLYGNSADTQFINNTISNNTGSPPWDLFGGAAGSPGFETALGNTIANNNFGSSAWVIFVPATGYTDGGGNTCGTTYPNPGPITCH
jgi:hypothetical protein